MGAAARAHPSVASVDDFDAPPSSWPDVLAGDSGLGPPTVLAAELRPRLDPAERTVAARVQRLKSIVHLVESATLFGRGIVHVSGSPLTVSSVSNWRPLGLRRAAVLVTAAVSFAAALLYGLTYDTRHAWYAHLGHGMLVLAIGVLLAASVTATVSGITLGGRARTPMRVWVPAGAMMLLLGALALRVTRDRPRATHARASLESGDVTSAALEADALRSLDIDRAAGDALLDTLHLRELRSVSDVDRVLVLANAPWASSDARAEARRMAVAALERRAETLIASGDADAMATLVDRARPISAVTSERLMRASALVKARRCAELGDGECTRARCRDVLEHGGDAHETAPILRRATERVAERFRDAVVRADAVRAPRERIAALRDALSRSEDLTTLTREQTTPGASELRDRIARAESELARIEARTNRDAGVPSRERSRRRAETQ
jgi:hypothetical protein